MKMLVKTGSVYSWGKLINTDSKTYVFPTYVVEILHGKYKGQKVATFNPLEKCPLGTFIDHRIPEANI